MGALSPIQRVHGPVPTGPLESLRARCNDVIRNRVAARLALRGGGEHGPHHLAVFVDDRPSRVAAVHLSAERGQLAGDRAAPIGVLGEHRPRRADAGGGDRERPVLRIAEHGARRAAPHVRGERQRCSPPGRRPGAAPGRSRGRSGPASRPGSRSEPAGVTVVSLSPATTCALVTTRPGAAIQPDPSTPRPQAVPSTRTTPALAAWTSGSRAIFESGAATSGLGPWTATRGSIRWSALISELEGGNALLSARRIEERCTAVRSPCAPGAFSATAPKSQARPSASATRSTAPPEDSAIAIPRRRPRLAEQASPDGDRDSLQRHGHDPADQQRAREGGGRRVGRVRAVGQERGAEAAADEGADREAPEAEHAHDQALLVPPERHRQGEGDDHPIEAGHGFPNTSARATTFADVNPPVTRSRTREGEAPRPGRPARPPRAQRGPLTERQRRLRQRALPLAVVALIAFIFGVISAAGSPEQDMAERFVKDWADQDYKSMHDELSDSAQAQYSAADLRSAYADSQNASTATAIDPGSADGPKNVNGTDVVDVGVGVRTKLFGKVDGTLRLPLDGGKVAWNPSLTFPGLHTGERVGRRLDAGTTRFDSRQERHGPRDRDPPTTAARPSAPTRSTSPERPERPTPRSRRSSRRPVIQATRTPV